MRNYGWMARAAVVLVVGSAVFVTVARAPAAVIFQTGFETAEGYPTSGGTWLYNHGWYNTTSAWNNPAPPNTWAIGRSGQRSAMVWAWPTEYQWCEHSAAFTPTPEEPIVDLSAYVAFQLYYSNVRNSSYAGIALVGKRADMSTKRLGGIYLGVNGNIVAHGYPGDVYTEARHSAPFGVRLGTWYSLRLQANFSTNTLSFFVEDQPMGAMSFSDVVGLHSIAMFAQTPDAWDMGHICRFDDLAVLSVPEPAALALLALGGMAVMRRRVP